MRWLHVAALPFPTRQGTQALIHEMVSALHAAGERVELLCYPHGVLPFASDYSLHRAADPLHVARSLRSGPSLEKLALDLTLLRALRERVCLFRPDVLVAHHVEAALLAHACALPVVYVAHTSLEAELPVYFPAAGARFWAAAGAALERWLCRKSVRTLAVSPLLSHMLTVSTGADVRAFVLPWTVPEPITAPERAAARERFGLGSELVLLYAGNLDAYQGLGPWLDGLARFAREQPFVWLVATEAERSTFARELSQAGLVERVRFVPLASEADRRAVHAAADLTLVPRHTPGGIPIKLFDALARGVPVLASERACAGTELGVHCRLVGDDGSEQLLAALRAFLGEAPSSREVRASAARSYLLQAHSPEAFVASFRALAV